MIAAVLLKTFEVSGIGIHTGERSTVVISRGGKESGVLFVSKEVEIPAAPRFLDPSSAFCTTLTNNGQSVRTVEHLLAALSALGQRDVRIEVDGPELPILDGSAAPWLTALKQNGADGCFRLLDLKERIVAVSGSSRAELIPLSREESPYIDATLDLSAVGRPTQRRRFFPTDSPFEEIASARTFAFESAVAEMKASGFAKGGSLDNALVIGKGGVLNPKGVRFFDEPVRHKLLDAVGDLSLLGGIPRAKIVLSRPGHHLLHEIICAISER